jgi:Ca2+-binding EF-hand superfamily protein
LPRRSPGKAPLQKEVEAIETEAGGDGVVDFAQFMNFYRRKFRRPQDLEREMREAFRALDATGYSAFLLQFAKSRSSFIMLVGFVLVTHESSS